MTDETIQMSDEGEEDVWDKDRLQEIAEHLYEKGTISGEELVLRETE